ALWHFTARRPSLERPARPVAGRFLVQDRLQLLARLRVPAHVDIELGQLDAHSGEARIETLRGFEVLLGDAAVAAQQHRQLAVYAAGHNLRLRVVWVELEA